MSRQEQAERNLACIRRDLVRHHWRAILFHLCGLARAIFGRQEMPVKLTVLVTEE